MALDYLRLTKDAFAMVSQSLFSGLVPLGKASSGNVLRRIAAGL